MQTDRQTDLHTDIHTDIHTDTYRYIQIHTDTYRYIQIHTGANTYILSGAEGTHIHTYLPIDFCALYIYIYMLSVDLFTFSTGYKPVSNTEMGFQLMLIEVVVNHF